MDNNGNNRTCQTGLIKGTYTGSWVSMSDTKDLGDCDTNFLIYNNSASIRVISAQNSRLNDEISIDEVEIGTDGSFIPSLSCGNGNNSQPMVALGERASHWTHCKRKEGMKKIKMLTSNAWYAGTDNYIKLKFMITTEDDTIVTCQTGDLNNIGNDRERGQTDNYQPRDGNFGNCTNEKLASALLERKKDEPIMLTVSSTNYGIADQWNPDLIKAYLTTSRNKHMVISCELCDSRKGDTSSNSCGGWGSYWITSGRDHSFECFVLEPKFPERSLQKIRVKTCDSYYAPSNTDQLRIEICKHNEVNTHTGKPTHRDRLAGKLNCCITNRLGSNFVSGQWTEDIDGDTVDSDGGEQLGQCEGFPIDGTDVTIGLKNDASNALCLDEYKFYGGGSSDNSIMDIPFIQCSTCQLWADSNEACCNVDSDWVPWEERKSPCRYNPDITNVKNIAMKVCDQESSGSLSKFQAVIKNIDQETCVSEQLQASFDTGAYIETDLRGNCTNLAIKEKKASIWLLNLDESDGLCITDVYLDVSNADGRTYMLKCRLDDEEIFQVHIQDTDMSAIPLTCL